MRALYSTDRQTGKRRLVGHCTCTPTLVCGLCVQLMIDPPESKDERATRLREARLEAREARREAWRKRRGKRYAALLEGRD